ncbi:MAG: hypothetical protein ACK56F_13395, partial [bacterium]
MILFNLPVRREDQYQADHSWDQMNHMDHKDQAKPMDHMDQMNHVDQMRHMDQMNHMDQMKRMDQVNHMDQMKRMDQMNHMEQHGTGQQDLHKQDPLEAQGMKAVLLLPMLKDSFFLSRTTILAYKRNWDHHI